MVSGSTCSTLPCMSHSKPSRMPSTSTPSSWARMVALPITLLMPGAGPPPTRIASAFRGLSVRFAGMGTIIASRLRLGKRFRPPPCRAARPPMRARYLPSGRRVGLEEAGVVPRGDREDGLPADRRVIVGDLQLYADRWREPECRHRHVRALGAERQLELPSTACAELEGANALRG